MTPRGPEVLLRRPPGTGSALRLLGTEISSLQDRFRRPECDQVTKAPKGVSGKVMASLLGITGRRLAQLDAQGVIAPIRRARAAESSTWDVKITVQTYIGYKLRETQRDRLFRLQADRVDIENRRRRQELLEAGEVEKEWAEIATAVKRAVLALPGRLFQLGIISSDKIPPATEAAHEVIRHLGRAGT